MELVNNELNPASEYKEWYDRILTISKEHNYDLYKKLNIKDNELQNISNENDKISILLCKKYLPKMVKNLFEVKDVKGKFKTENGIKTLTNTIKESPSEPLIFITKFAQDSFLAGVNSDSVMGNLMPKDFIENENNENFNKKFIKTVQKRAPNLYQKYMVVSKETKIQNNIASLHFR